MVILRQDWTACGYKRSYFEFVRFLKGGIIPDMPGFGVRGFGEFIFLGQGMIMHRLVFINELNK